MRPRNLIAAVLVLGAAVLVVVLVLSRGGAPRPTVSSIAATVVPGATATLMPAPSGVPGAEMVRIMVPDALVHLPAPARDSSAASVLAAAGWRGALIAAAAATRMPAVTQFAVTDKAGAQPPEAAFYLDGAVRMAPGQDPAAGMTRLDTISPSAARRQLEDNLGVLMRGLPAGSIGRAAITEIQVDPARHGVALAVELEVKDLRSLRGHLGDLLGGLATGLAPGLDSTVEGVSIHAVDAGGRHAGSWIATRSQQGTTVMDPRIKPPPVMVPRLHFVNETGGPGPVASAHA
ncbi:MAG: hypothetical protein QOE44_2520 [Solirubrobacteraceae bacterium]|jgi:hypothetical protein|nr:hypothetical protein [Solirubrobacteraceae bacterium]